MLKSWIQLQAPAQKPILPANRDFQGTRCHPGREAPTSGGDTPEVGRWHREQQSLPMLLLNKKALQVTLLFGDKVTGVSHCRSEGSPTTSLLVFETIPTRDIWEQPAFKYPLSGWLYWRHGRDLKPPKKAVVTLPGCPPYLCTHTFLDR